MPPKRNRRLERAFVTWLGLQDAQIRGAIIFDPPRQTRSFKLKHGAIEIMGSVDDRGIDIFCERDGECWDIILSLVVVPEAIDGRYHCLACLPCFRRTFADLDTLWRNHLFGPLLGWMRRRLFRADRLAYYCAPRATWVKLLRPSDDPRNPADVIYARPLEAP